MAAKKTKIGVLIAGFALIFFGLTLSFFFDQIIFKPFEQGLPLRPESESFRKWRLTPVPLTMSIYFWNWTNPDQITNEDYKPSFVEMGPYVYREVHEKVNVNWNHEDGTVTYQTIKRWYFDQEKTKGSLDDNVTSLNAVAASVAYIVRSWNRFFLYPVSAALTSSGQKLTWTKPVRELIFEGFENSLQNMGSYVPGFPSLDKFGWFYKRNGTTGSDRFTIGTGEKNLDEIGELKLWNDKNLTSLYPECPKMGGYNGEFWPPRRTKEDILKMFTPDICRDVNYYYEEETVHEGLKVLVFAGTEKSVDNGTKVEDNKCHYDKEFRPPSGVFDVSKCQFGAPVFMSYPHFYMADPVYRDAVEGMNPDREKHRFYIALEPRTGLQVEVKARMQLNLYLKKNPSLSMYRNVRDVFVPVFWVENSVSLSPEYTEGVRIMLAIVKFGPFFYYGSCLLGLLIIAGVVLLHVYAYPVSAILRKGKRKRAGSEKFMLKKPEETQIERDENSIKEVEYNFSEMKL